MYTEQMTIEEIWNETQAELENLRARCHATEIGMRRRILKATKFPIQVQYEQRTVRKNRWICKIVVLSKKGVGGRNYFNAYCLHETRDGKFYITTHANDKPARSEKNIVICKPHFFRRYNERLKLGLHGEELIRHFHDTHEAFNFEFFGNHEDGEKMAASFSEGYALGSSYRDRRVLVMCTFVTKDMLVDKQLLSYLKSEDMRLEYEERIMEQMDERLQK